MRAGYLIVWLRKSRPPSNNGCIAFADTHSLTLLAGVVPVAARRKRQSEAYNNMARDSIRNGSYFCLLGDLRQSSTHTLPQLVPGAIPSATPPFSLPLPRFTRSTEPIETSSRPFFAMLPRWSRHGLEPGSEKPGNAQRTAHVPSALPDPNYPAER